MTTLTPEEIALMAPYEAGAALEAITEHTAGWELSAREALEIHKIEKALRARANETYVQLTK
jgi:hypothetical protein